MDEKPPIRRTPRIVGQKTPPRPCNYFSPSLRGIIPHSGIINLSNHPAAFSPTAFARELASNGRKKRPKNDQNTAGNLPLNYP
jgi:hypothetical protein